MQSNCQIEKLKSFSATKYTLEDLIALSAFAKALHAEYALFSVQSPEWLTRALRDVPVAIKERNRAEIERRLSAAKSRRASLKTADERRKEADAEIAELEAILG